MYLCVRGIDFAFSHELSIGFVNWSYIYIFILVVVTGDILCVMCKMKQILLDTHGEVYSIQHYVIKFVSDLQQVCGILRIFRFPPPIKLTVTI